jgi:hypothetical protein
LGRRLSLHSVFMRDARASFSVALARTAATSMRKGLEKGTADLLESAYQRMRDTGMRERAAAISASVSECGVSWERSRAYTDIATEILSGTKERQAFSDGNKKLPECVSLAAACASILV